MCVQNQGMTHLLQSCGSPMQTYSIGSTFDGEINMTFTSMFDDTLNQWAPVLTSVLFSKTVVEAHTQHWNELVCKMKASDCDVQSGAFPGDASDVSDALGISFFSSLKAMAQKSFIRELSNDAILPLCAFHLAHFNRS